MDDREINERKTEKKKCISNPLEELFDIESNTTTTPPSDYVPRPNCDHTLYNDKDREIEAQFQEIYNAAMESFYNQTENVSDVDPKYRARNGEVSVQYLNSALAAAREKANLKAQKEKLEVAAKKTQAGDGGLVLDRNDLLKLLKKNIEDIDT